MATPSSQESLDRLHKLLSSTPEAEEKKMFGITGVKANGYVFAYLNGDTLVFKLNAEDGAKVGGEIYNPSGKIPMNGFYVLHADTLGNESMLSELFVASYKNVLSLPKKEPKPKKAKKAE